MSIPKKRKLSSSADVGRLGDELNAAPREKANNLPILISHVSSNSNKVSPAVINSLKLYFIGCFEREELQGRAPDTATDPSPAAVYAAWLHRQFAACTAALLGVLTSGADARTQVTALSALMEFCRGRPAGAFDNELFSSIVSMALTQAGVAGEVLGALTEKYGPHADVMYHLLRTIHKICDRRAARPAAGAPAPEDDGSDGDWEGAGVGAGEGAGVGGVRGGSPPNKEVAPHDLARTLLDVLLRLPTPAAAEEDFTSWCGAAEVGTAAAAADATGARDRKRARKKAPAEGGAPLGPKMVAKWASTKLRRRAYSDAWMSFLRLDLPDDAYRRALSHLHDLVIPNLLTPLLLSDFLTHSLDRGGLVGMLALNGIFILVTGHGLEYPRFYDRLYGLLTPDAFLSRHRLRFFQLADIFLASGLVPAYTCAAFAKRFGRLALSAPPGGALVALAFIHNILRRHPACMQLLHRAPKGPAPGPDAAPVWQGQDVYDPQEPDPAKTRALESSLWELRALQCHADPSVSAYCSILEKDLSDRRKTAEVDVGEVLGASYASLFWREVERRLKAVPAAFYAQAPQGLFGSAAGGAAGFVEGWGE